MSFSKQEAADAAAALLAEISAYDDGKWVRVTTGKIKRHDRYRHPHWTPGRFNPMGYSIGNNMEEAPYTNMIIIRRVVS